MKSKTLLAALRCLLLIFFGFWCTNLQASSAEAIGQRAYCNIGLHASQNQLRWIFEHWLSRRDSVWNIERNFKRLRKENDKRFSQILSVADLGNADVATAEAVKSQLRLLDQRSAQSLLTFSDVRVANDQFEASLFAIEAAIADLLSELEALVPMCDTHRPLLKKMQGRLDDVKSIVNTYRTYVIQSTVKAENLFLVVSELARARLYQTYIKRTNQRLEDVRQHIEDALALDRIYGKYAAWWQYNSMKVGIGHELHRRYLQYYEPLLIMREQRERAIEFEREIAEKVKPSPTKDRVLTEITFSRQLIEKEISALEQNGWASLRDRQIELNKHRAAKATNEDCKVAIQTHFKIASAANSLAQFRNASSLYGQAVNLCDREANP